VDPGTVIEIIDGRGNSEWMPLVFRDIRAVKIEILTLFELKMFLHARKEERKKEEMRRIQLTAALTR
jgi:hypothetical protein